MLWSLEGPFWGSSASDSDPGAGAGDWAGLFPLLEVNRVPACVLNCPVSGRSMPSRAHAPMRGMLPPSRPPPVV